MNSTRTWRAMLPAVLLLLAACGQQATQTDNPDKNGDLDIVALQLASDPPTIISPAVFSWKVTGSPETRCEFDAGDGSAIYTVEDCAGEQEQTHSYGSKGVFTAKLSVTDPAGNEELAELEVEVVNMAPVAKFDYDHSHGEYDVGLDASASYDPDGTIVEYRWDLGYENTYDDEVVWGAGWSRGGEHQIKLTVVDDEGATAEASVTVWVDLNVDRLSAGSFHTLYAAPDGTLWAWGRSTYGMLGLEGGNRLQPDEVTRLKDVVGVAAGQFHSLVLLEDGTVWSMGLSQNGRLGDGTNGIGGKYIPARVPGLEKIVDIAAGSAHSLALHQDGTVWAWGANSSGQLGLGDTVQRLSPVQIPDLENVTALAAGVNSSYALANGSVWAWGDNDAAQQVGNGSANDALVPVQLTGLRNVIELDAGHYHVVAMDSSGAVWTWGENSDGQLGNGTTTPSPIPQEIFVDWSPEYLIDIAAGGNHSFALRFDGWTRGWGRQASWQLGVPRSGNALEPITVASNIDARKISAGSNFSVAIDMDGKLWAWGEAGYGQLGIGSTADVSVPVEVKFPDP